MKELDRLDREIENITILKGLEVNIKSDGKLEIKEDILKDLDVIVAGINSGYRQSKEQLTDESFSHGKPVCEYYSTSHREKDP